MPAPSHFKLSLAQAKLPRSPLCTEHRANDPTLPQAAALEADTAVSQALSTSTTTFQRLPTGNEDHVEDISSLTIVIKVVRDVLSPQFILHISIRFNALE